MDQLSHNTAKYLGIVEGSSKRIYIYVCTFTLRRTGMSPFLPKLMLDISCGTPRQETSMQKTHHSQKKRTGLQTVKVLLGPEVTFTVVIANKVLLY